jgi:hypothetical protein
MHRASCFPIRGTISSDESRTRHTFGTEPSHLRDVHMGTHVHVQRLHIMLDERRLLLLRDEAARTDLSLGELVRRAIDKTYRPAHRPRVRGYELSLGIWRRPDAAVAGRRPRLL